jgi:hypothetical protein
VTISASYTTPGDTIDLSMQNDLLKEALGKK